MSDITPDHLVLNLLRAIRGDVAAIKDDMSDMRRRMTTLEIQVTNLANIEGSHHANTMLRLDGVVERLDRIVVERLDRIERRLELTNAAT